MNSLRARLGPARKLARPTYDRLRRARAGVSFLEPNYIYRDKFNLSSIVIDVGCGHLAEFALYLIKAHHLRAFGVDPTRKHATDLMKLQQITNGHFQYLPLAVSKHCGPIVFHESVSNESGSVLAQHANVARDTIRTYPVEAVDLMELVRRIGGQSIDLIKLDLEGAEYELLQSASKPDLAPFKQIFVEFHHHCTDYSMRDTEVVVERLRGLDLNTFTMDKHNYLFYR
jgi:FkbM family methyltransferase